MCKLFILTNTSKLSHNKLSKLLTVTAKIMGKTDSHGFGWSMLNGDSFTGEKCVDPEYFENSFFSSVPSQLKSIFGKSESEVYGEMPKKLSGALLVHARISTNQLGLINTHPFINEDWSLIHNGVVTNETDHVERKSSNDTEYLLHHLTHQGVDGMVSSVAGYYAVGAISRKTGDLLVVKDNIANLYACYIETLDSLAFGTSASQLESIIKTIGYKHSKITPVKDNMAFTFDKRGMLTSERAITPIARKTYNEADYYASMGYDTTGDYNRRSESVYSTESINKSIQIEDVPNDVPPVKCFDFIDEYGEPVPKHRLDSVFMFLDYNNQTMSADEFLDLDDVDQEYCDVYNRHTNELIERLAS